MIVIDGSFGEGGGQIVRSAVAFSALTGKPIRVYNIRAKRSNPGLRPQHLNAIRAVTELCGAEVKGLEVGSRELFFKPRKLGARDVRIDVGTAGSLTLLLQALLIPACLAPKPLRIELKGGTDVRWSPPIDYLRLVTLPILENFGPKVEVETKRRGYYPKGGGVVKVCVNPVKGLRGVELLKAGELQEIVGVSHAHRSLEGAKVAERQAKAAKKELLKGLMKLDEETKVSIEVEYCDTFSVGSGIVLCAVTEASRLGSSSLGEKGKLAEVVGKEAANSLLEELRSGAALDRHMGDQIIPYLAVGGGVAETSEVTLHAATNAEVARMFGFNVRIEGKRILAST